MKTRLEQLLEMHNSDPADPFLIYGLALEYQKTDLKKSWEYFQKLLQEHEDYIPAYYHAGKLEEALGNLKNAEEIYLKGIEKGEQQKEFHAVRELKGALNFLMDDEEDF